MRVFLFKFRPSSHSVDLTIFAVFDKESCAAKAFNTVKKFLDTSEWRFDEFWISLKGTLVNVRTPTAYAIRDIKDVLYETGALAVDVGKEVPKSVLKSPNVAGKKCVRRKAGGKEY